MVFVFLSRKLSFNKMFEIDYFKNLEAELINHSTTTILTLSEAGNNFSVEIIEISQKRVIINQSKPLP